MDKKLRVGINVWNLNATVINRLLWKLFRLSLHITAKRMPEVEFIFIDTRIVSDDRKAFMPMGAFNDCPNSKEYKFSDTEEDLHLIGDLDIIFSDKLHLGLVCMSFGKPFISVLGQAKTRLMLDNIGLSRNYFGTWRAFLLPFLLLSKKYISDTIRKFEVPGIDTITSSARGHLEELTGIISKYAR